jgi:hypothetical protein
MRTPDSSKLRKRWAASAIATMLTTLGCSVAVIEQDGSIAPEHEGISRPFWSTDVAASNLAVVQLQQTGSGWSASAP